MIFVELLVVEVHHLEIVIGEAPGGFPDATVEAWRRLQDMPFELFAFGPWI